MWFSRATTPFRGTIDILQNLKGDERKLVERLRDAMKQSAELTERVCRLLIQKLSDETVKLICELDLEAKVQACVSHLVIGLMSGQVRRKDVEILLK